MKYVNKANTNMSANNENPNGSTPMRIGTTQPNNQQAVTPIGITALHQSHIVAESGGGGGLVACWLASVTSSSAGVEDKRGSEEG